MQFLQMILSVFVLFLCASPIVSNPRQERQASGNEVDLDDEGMFTSLIFISYDNLTTFRMWDFSYVFCRCRPRAYRVLWLAELLWRADPAVSGHVSEDVVAGNNTLILACHVSPRVIQCPSRLHLMSCYSDFISPFGSLPVQCYPDAAAHIEEAESLGLTGSPREVTRL